MLITLKGKWLSTNRFESITGEEYYVAAFGMTRNQYVLPIDCYLLLQGVVIITVFKI